MTLLFFICVLRSKEPVTLVRKHFPLSSGLLELEASLDNHLYSHGDEIMIDVNVRNNSDKTVKRISAVVLQQVDIAMFKGMHVLICGYEMVSFVLFSFCSFLNCEQHSFF